MLAWQRGDTSHLLEPARKLLERVPRAHVVARRRRARRGGGRRDRRSPRATASAFVDRLDHLDLRWDVDARDDGAHRGGPHHATSASAAARLLEPLEPFADRICVVSLNVTEFGPVSRSLGVLATLARRLRPRGRALRARARPRAAPSARARTWRARRSTTRAMLKARRAAGDGVRAASLLERGRRRAPSSWRCDGLRRDIAALRID